MADPTTGYQGVNPWDSSMGCRDWVTDQWDAWFNNVPFFVASDARSGGRRIHVHEYPTKEEWDNEDLGRLRQQVDVQAYVVGDGSAQWAELLFAACTAPGWSTLYLPMRAPLRCYCMQVESTFQADQ